jgi:hypothetical protein
MPISQRRSKKWPKSTTWFDFLVSGHSSTCQTREFRRWLIFLFDAERQKATRKLNKLKKELNTHRRNVPDDLTRSVEDAQVELNYTLHYPRGEKYISLFKNPGNNNNMAEKRDMIKQDIKHRMEQGTLGAPTTGGDDTQQYISQSARYCKDKTKTGKEKKERSSDQTGGNIEEDDFFEF